MTPVNAAPRHTGNRPAPAGLFRSPKIQPWHLDRLAVVYVRQSSPQQVHEHRESGRLQYDLRDRAVALGWPADRIVVIDNGRVVANDTLAGLHALAPAGATSLESVFLTLTGRSLRD